MVIAMPNRDEFVERITNEIRVLKLLEKEIREANKDTNIDTTPIQELINEKQTFLQKP